MSPTGDQAGKLVFLQRSDARADGHVQARRPFPTWGTALSLDSYVTSSYNSLQVKAQKRFARGFLS